MERKIIRSAAVLATVAALTVGVAGTASAQNPFGSLSSVTGSLGQSDLAVPQGEKMRLGNVGGSAWNVDVYSQVYGATQVAPGAEVKVRVEVVGVKGETAIRELRQSMPAGFALTKVETS